jgi:hypothetical protein
VVERHGFFASGDKLFVQNVQHFQKRHVRGNALQLVVFESALGLALGLTPDA